MISYKFKNNKISTDFTKINNLLYKVNLKKKFTINFQ